ncbi:hypothetical protein K1719_044191 [Acacia pycnantha]|nr:hypothetical protein K1719_044191 [Acacia pycnantha]
MEGDMDVEGVEVKKKNGAGSPEAKDHWKTVQRPNRQRRYVNPVPNQNLGSRFTVLNEAGGEEAAMGEAEKEVEGSRGEEWTSKGQGRGVSSVPNKAETRRVLGETNKGACEGRVVGVWGGWPEIKLGAIWGEESQFEWKGKSESGDCSVKGGVKEGRTSTDLSQAVEDEDPNGGLDTSMEEECAAQRTQISGIQSESCDYFGTKDQRGPGVKNNKEVGFQTFSKKGGSIYANPNEHRRHELWEMLSSIGSEVNVPWLLAGHFNEIKTPLEQVGGGRVNESRCRRFNTWIRGL